jgi:hypothetical protein
MISFGDLADGIGQSDDAIVLPFAESGERIFQTRLFKIEKI